MFPSASPNTKRNLKPTVQQSQQYTAGTSASPTQLTLPSNQPPGPYSTLGHPQDPFAAAAAYQSQAPQAAPGPLNPPPPPQQQQPNPRKRRADEPLQAQDVVAGSSAAPFGDNDPLGPPGADLVQPPSAPPPKKGRTNTPWTPAEEQRLKTMRDQGTSWSEIAKVFIHESWVLDSSAIITDLLSAFSLANGRQCQETLVQGELRIKSSPPALRFADFQCLRICIMPNLLKMRSVHSLVSTW